jgi:hypothetical protein
MVNSSARTGLDFENAAPDRGRYSELRRDGGAALTARRLRRAEIELIGPDDADFIDLAHDASSKLALLNLRACGARGH